MSSLLKWSGFHSEVDIIRKHSRHSLSTLFNRLMIAVMMTIGGSLVIAGSRLEAVRTWLGLEESLAGIFVLDLIAMASVIFGLLTIWGIVPEFRARLARLDHLGENDW